MWGVAGGLGRQFGVDPMLFRVAFMVSVVFGGIGLTFGMWWIYFFMPSGDVLHHRREKSFLWGYGHIFVFAAIAATGAGLHVAALAIEGEARISDWAVMLSIAIPVAVYFVMLIALNGHLVGLHVHALALTIAKLGVLALAAYEFRNMDY